MNQKGFASVLIVVILLSGVVLATYLAQQKTNLFPKAFEPSLKQTPSTIPLPTPDPNLFVNKFQIGIFENGNPHFRDEVETENMLIDGENRGFNSLMIVGGNSRFENMFDVTDKHKLDVFINFHLPLYYDWFNEKGRHLDKDKQDWNWLDPIEYTPEEAKKVAQGIIDQYKKHPSLKGYYLNDEPNLYAVNHPQIWEKIKMMVAAFKELDPVRPAAPIFMGIPSPELVDELKLPVVIGDIYSYYHGSPKCSVSTNEYFYQSVSNATKHQVPVWVILQAFDGENSLWRFPLPQEVRFQQWASISQGVHGIYWYIYHSTYPPYSSTYGFKDKPEVLEEITKLNKRLEEIAPILVQTKYSTKDSVSLSSGSNHAITSVLINPYTNQKYIVLVNKDCIPQTFSFKGSYKDIETGDVITRDQPLTLEGGDAKIVEFSDDTKSTPLKITKSNVKVLGNTATISWVTNIPTAGTVKFGKDKSNLTGSQSEGNSSTSHSITLTNLDSGVTYYYSLINTSTTQSQNSPTKSFKIK